MSSLRQSSAANVVSGTLFSRDAVEKENEHQLSRPIGRINWRKDSNEEVQGDPVLGGRGKSEFSRKFPEGVAERNQQEYPVIWGAKPCAENAASPSPRTGPLVHR